MSTAANPLLVDLGEFVRERFTFGVRHVLELLDKTIGSRRLTRFAALLLVYVAQFAAVFWLAYELRWDFETPAEFLRQREVLILPVVLCKLLLLYSFGQFKRVLSYFGLADFAAGVSAMTFVSGAMVALGTGRTSRRPRHAVWC